jgi:hypothetical protein
MIEKQCRWKKQCINKSAIIIVALMRDLGITMWHKPWRPEKTGWARTIRCRF